METSASKQKSNLDWLSTALRAKGIFPQKKTPSRRPRDQNRSASKKFAFQKDDSQLTLRNFWQDPSGQSRTNLEPSIGTPDQSGPDLDLKNYFTAKNHPNAKISLDKDIIKNELSTEVGLSGKQDSFTINKMFENQMKIEHQISLKKINTVSLDKDSLICGGDKSPDLDIN
jgi:hypothetical protein